MATKTQKKYKAHPDCCIDCAKSEDKDDAIVLYDAVGEVWEEDLAGYVAEYRCKNGHSWKTWWARLMRVPVDFRVEDHNPVPRRHVPRIEPDIEALRRARWIIADHRQALRERWPRSEDLDRLIEMELQVYQDLGELANRIAYLRQIPRRIAELYPERPEPVRLSEIRPIIGVLE